MTLFIHLPVVQEAFEFKLILGRNVFVDNKYDRCYFTTISKRHPELACATIGRVLKGFTLNRLTD
jgi:hypothetical protein